MVRDTRIKDYRFSIGSLTSNAGGVIDVYTSYPLNGTLESIERKAASYTNTGSLFVSISGTNQQVYQLISGTAIGTNVGIADVVNPVKTNVNIEGSTLSIFTKIPINSKIHLIGSGLGNGASGLGLNIVYI